MTGKRYKKINFRILSGCLVGWLLVTAQLYAHPLQSSRGAAGNEQQILKDAQGAFADKNIQLARQKAEQIRDAQGSIGEQARTLLKLIDDITENNRKRQNAIIAIQRRNFAEACGFLNEIQAAVDANKPLRDRYPDLSNLKTQAGGCPSAAPPPPPTPQPVPEQVEAMKSQYDKAVNLMDDGKLPEALRIFKRIQQAHPGYKDVAALMDEIDQELAGNKPKPKNKEAERVSGKSSKPSQESSSVDSGSIKPQQKTDEARKREENELVDALTAFYAGKYEQSYKALEDFLRRTHSLPMTAFARFYAGAALGNRYFLSGGKDESARNAAIQSFQQALKSDPSFSPRWDTVSPKIRSLFAEATRK